MFRTMSLGVVAVAAMLPGALGAATLELTGTVRDFLYNGSGIPAGFSAHPDFEAPIGGLAPGIVQNTVDGDGKPVLSPTPPGNASIASAASFGQWYRDVPGVNQSTTFSITLNEISPGLFSYVNGNFFPIDGQLLGNQGLGHNYHFTYEIAGTFGYSAGTNQVFTFQGDDDVWVFLNDRLAIDLGGIHGTVSASVNLDTFAPTGGLVDGGNYTFRLFFAERHTTASSFRIETSLPIVSQPVPEPGSYVLALSGLALLAFFGRARGRKG
jgi:fibro-slime domain-containing protein